MSRTFIVFLAVSFGFAAMSAQTYIGGTDHPLYGVDGEIKPVSADMFFDLTVPTPWGTHTLRNTGKFWRSSNGSLREDDAYGRSVIYDRKQQQWIEVDHQLRTALVKPTPVENVHGGSGFVIPGGGGGETMTGTLEGRKVIGYHQRVSPRTGWALSGDQEGWLDVSTKITVEQLVSWLDGLVEHLRLRNLHEEEPDPALFQIPQGYVVAYCSPSAAHPAGPRNHRYPLCIPPSSPPSPSTPSLLSAFFSLAGAQAQGTAQPQGAAQPQGEEPPFPALTTDVRVDASVKYQGAILRDLKQEDFVILDEGQPRTANAFAAASAPLDLVILLQTGAVNGPKAFFAPIAARAEASLRPSDRAGVVWEDYNRESIYHNLRLTSKPEEVAAALERAGRKTNYTPDSTLFGEAHWAAWMIEDELRKHPPVERRKQAMLLISRVAFGTGLPGDPVIQHLWSIHTPLHAILLPFLGSDGIANPALSPRAVQPLYVAQQTGGEVLWTDEKGSLDKIPEFIRNIQSSYSLWFTAAPASATSTSGSVRHITVELSDAAKKKYPGAQVIARQGYIVP